MPPFCAGRRFDLRSTNGNVGDDDDPDKGARDSAAHAGAELRAPSQREEVK